MTRTELLKIVVPLIQEPVFLVDIELAGGSQGPLVRVILDTDAGITVNECAEWNRELGDIFEVRELFRNRYTLEVTSPGLSRPLQLPRQYRKNIGRRLQVILTEAEESVRLIGQLQAVDEAEILLELPDGVRTIPFAGIIEAKVKPAI
ncbi:MAG: hypothetical protein ISR91_04990 [Candidatus Delongbacteria bacterium]|nr:hypothetical protein [Candidatus Delongbacteria bacterium]